MWKIENNSNAKYLQKFESEIIIPIFKMILEVIVKIENYTIKLPVERKDIWKSTRIYESTIKKDLYDYLMKKVIAGRNLEDIIYRIAIEYDQKAITDVYDLYKYQNQEVNVGNYSISQAFVNSYIKDIFVDFYYSNLFVDEYMWEILVGEKYNRSFFHRNFQKENNLAVCPYCDIDTIVSVSNINIEHFLPKSKFPLLAMNPLNLISSCYACNKAQEGKGDRVSNPPIVTPYNEKIGVNFEFKINFEDEIITLQNNGGKAHENYLKLLKLSSRYADPFIFSNVDDKANSLFESLSNYGSASKQSIFSYINQREKKENLSFALKSAISNYPQFGKYK